VDDFKDNEFYKTALANIAMPSGTPLSILLANSANKATAQMEYKSWYDNAVIPLCSVVSRGLNQSAYMRKLGLRLEFRTKETDPDQEEEQKKSYSFTNYASVFTNNRHPEPLSLAAKLVGIDLPEGVDWKYLDLQKKAEEQPEKQPQDNEQPQVKPVSDPDEPRDEEKAFIPTAEQDKELETWKNKAKRDIEHNRDYKAWEPKDIPTDVAEKINAQLAKAKTIDEVVKAFVLKSEKKAESDADIIALVEAMNRLAERPDETKATQFHMSPITVNVPERSVTVTPELKADAPIVNINVPEQPAPVVNVTNEVNPTPIEVKNDVHPATVAIKSPKKAKVKRGKDGKIESIEAQ